MTTLSIARYGAFDLAVRLVGRQEKLVAVLEAERGEVDEQAMFVGHGQRDL